MTKRPRHLGAAFALSALLFVGSGCSWGELDTLIDFMNDWSTEKGYTDASGNPTPKAAKDYLLGTGDPLTDAALGAGAATSGLKETEKAFANVNTLLATGKYDDADKELKKLERQRPNDWEVMNRRALANIEMGRFDAADEKMRQADEKACKTDRCKIAMLENRAAISFAEVTRAAPGPAREKECKKLKMSRNAHSQLAQQYELMAINTHSNTNLVEAQRLRTKYDNLANHQANLAMAMNGDLAAHCGGAI